MSGRPQPTVANAAASHAYPLIGSVLITAFATMLLLAAADEGWTGLDTATVSVGVALAAWMGTGWWSGRGSTRQQSEFRSPVSHDQPPIVIREPESAWWDTQPEVSPTAMTVVVVGESDTWYGGEAVVAQLARLAVNDEVLVVHGSQDRDVPGHHAVVAGLRDRLPRHHVVALNVADNGGLERGTAALLEHLLENGSLPVVNTTAAAVADVAAQISSSVRADRVLRMSGTTHGTDLHQVWRRHATASIG